MGLLFAMAGCVIVDAMAPQQWIEGKVIATRYAEGSSMTTLTKVGDNVYMPVTTEISGAWMVKISAPILGEVELAADRDDYRPGQTVYLRYHIGRLTRQPQVDGLEAHLPEIITK
jgi:hypothetical protein